MHFNILLRSISLNLLFVVRLILVMLISLFGKSETMMRSDKTVEKAQDLPLVERSAEWRSVGRQRLLLVDVDDFVQFVVLDMEFRSLHTALGTQHLTARVCRNLDLGLMFKLDRIGKIRAYRSPMFDMN